ncbi:MAG: GIY-YIG nuclease family protein [Alphaproteobacteria bacterium]
MKIYLDDKIININDESLKQKGAYAIGFTFKKDKNIHVGSLGLLHFKAGQYFYIGNAYGGGGLQSRLKRHIKRDKKKHWHFDYIRPYVAITNIFTFVGGDECYLVQQFQQKYDGAFLHKKLGSMDCRKCFSHIVYYT